MAIVPSINALKHVQLMLNAAAADSDYQAHLAEHIMNRPEVAERSRLTSDDYRQVARFLEQTLQDREAPPKA